MTVKYLFKKKKFEHRILINKFLYESDISFI